MQSFIKKIWENHEKNLFSELKKLIIFFGEKNLLVDLHQKNILPQTYFFILYGCVIPCTEGESGQRNVSQNIALH